MSYVPFYYVLPKAEWTLEPPYVLICSMV